MKNVFFECKVRYEKTMDDGSVKKVTEPYLVEALSFTEAESRFLEEINPYMSGEYEINAVAKRKISELFDTRDEDAGKWHKVKCAFITLDEKTGVEKKSNQIMYVKASDLRDAVKRFDKCMEGTMADYEILSVAETPIMDVFYYPLSK